MIGEQVGNFRIVQRLGMGGMGEVYLAEQETVRTKVAIKMLLPHISAGKEHVQRFFNEAIAASKIQHAGIVKIFDVGFLRSPGTERAYLVMEYLDGETLGGRIKRLGRLPLSQIGDIGRQISSVLDAVHKAGITHRDLKPDNIFLVPDAELASGERVKILDFGIAKLTGPSGGMTSTSVGSMGTPAYMSPEQWRNSAKVDWRADAYSLGCLAFEMASGRPPFPAESIGEACTKHLTEDPPRLASVVPGMPPALDALLWQLLAKGPEARPASMKLIGSTFESVASQDAYAPTVPQPARTPPASAQPSFGTAPTTLGGASGESRTPASRTPKGVIAGVAVLLVALVAVGALVATSSSSKQTEVAAASAPSASGAVSVIPPSIDAAVALAEAPPADAAQLPVDAAAEPATQIVKRPRPTGSAGSVTASTEPPKRLDKGPGASGGNCDEVACLLNNYEGACCAKYKARKPGGRSNDSNPASAELEDTPSRAAIQEGISKVRGRATACADKFPDAKGQVKVRLVISPDGSVASVDVATTPDPGLGACVASAAKGARFPRSRNGVTISYPFMF